MAVGKIIPSKGLEIRTVQPLAIHVARIYIYIYKGAGDKIETNEMGGHVERMGEGRGVLKVLVGKLGGNRPLGRPRRRWEDNIKIDLQEVGKDCGD